MTSDKVRVMCGTRERIEAMEPPLLDVRLSFIPSLGHILRIKDVHYSVINIYWDIGADDATVILELEEEPEDD